MEPEQPNKRLVKIAPNTNSPTSNLNNFPVQIMSEKNGPFRRIAPNTLFLPPVYNIPKIEKVKCVVKECNKQYDDNSRLFTHIKTKHTLPKEEKIPCYCSKCEFTEEQNPYFFYQNHFKVHSKRAPSMRTRFKKKTNKEEVTEKIPILLRGKDMLPTLNSIMQPYSKDGLEAEDSVDKLITNLEDKKNAEDPFQYITDIPSGDF